MILASSTTQLTSQEILFFSLAGLSLLVVVLRIIYRAFTGHVRDDFMSPSEARRTYLPTEEEAQQDAAYIPTEEEKRSNRKAWTVAIIGMLIISAIYFASGGMK